ncbi:hypothetical protein D5086_023138 [Populus alba]|uniref:Uncharacterized protein n=1 Tax=Populus alba TaxID=43335 RepID=A0ACC4B8Y9_POPAL
MYRGKNGVIFTTVLAEFSLLGSTFHLQPPCSSSLPMPQELNISCILTENSPCKLAVRVYPQVHLTVEIKKFSIPFTVSYTIIARLPTPNTSSDI